MEFEWEPIEDQNALMVIPQTPQMPMQQFAIPQQMPATMPAMPGNQMHFPYSYPSGPSSYMGSLVAFPTNVSTDFGFSINIDGKEVPSILPEKSILEGLTEKSSLDKQHYMSWLMWDDIVDVQKNPTYVILDLGCTRCMGSRKYVEAFLKKCPQHGIEYA